MMVFLCPEGPGLEEVSHYEKNFPTKEQTKKKSSWF